MPPNTQGEKLQNPFHGNPNQQLGFEISAEDDDWSFAPEFYPSDFTQAKKRKMNRYSGGCEGEQVSISAIKNRELHAAGMLIASEISTFQDLMDYTGSVTIYSPLNPNGGLECEIKSAELGNEKGWDPHTRQRMFEYRIDFVSTGRDEYDRGRNAIVSQIIDENTARAASDGL